jgi:hypothetical protein
VYHVAERGGSRGAELSTSICVGFLYHAGAFQLKASWNIRVLHSSLVIFPNIFISDFLTLNVIPRKYNFADDVIS